MIVLVIAHPELTVVKVKDLLAFSKIRKELYDGLKFQVGGELTQLQKSQMARSSSGPACGAMSAAK